jgi:hypothetical protein
MMRRTTPVLCGAVLLTTLATGCGHGGGATSPTPPPATTASGSPSSTALPYSGAPKVENPLPASVLYGAPCTDGLTSQQLTEILTMVPPTRPDNIAGVGPSCTWINSDKGALVSVGYDTLDHTGLSSVFQNTKPQATVWKPLPAIQGFPAVAHVTPSGGDPAEFCQVSVGLADNLAIDVSISLGPAKKGKVDPCQVTAQVADMVVTNLRQKAGA